MTAQEGDGPTEVPEDQGMLSTLFYACRVHFQRENITPMQGSSLNRTIFSYWNELPGTFDDRIVCSGLHMVSYIERINAPYFSVLIKVFMQCLYIHICNLQKFWQLNE